MRVGNMLRRADFQKNFILMTFKAIQYKFKMSDIKRLRHNSSHKQIFFKKRHNFVFCTSYFYLRLLNQCSVFFCTRHSKQLWTIEAYNKNNSL